MMVDSCVQQSTLIWTSAWLPSLLAGLLACRVTVCSKSFQDTITRMFPPPSCFPANALVRSPQLPAQ